MISIASICFCLTAAMKLLLRDGDKKTSVCVCVYTIFFGVCVGGGGLGGGGHRLLPGKGVSDTGV